MVDWDLYAQRYEAVQRGDPVHKRAIEEIAARIDSADGKDILDLGCGSGDVTQKVLERFPGANITGMDPSAEMRKVYSRRFENCEGVDAREGDGTTVSSPDSSFDILVSHIALHHILPEKRRDCAREMARVLRMGGKLVYADCFTRLPGPTDDRRWQDDVIDTQIAWAKYCLDNGAIEKALVLVKSIPLVLTADGEYPTTTEAWSGYLDEAGFVDLMVSVVSREEFGIRIIEATR